MGNRFIMGILMGMCIGLTGISYAGNDGFAGYWRTSFGHLTIRVEGARVSGNYSDGARKGSISGTVSTGGRLLTGSWTEGQTGGNVVFRLQEGGNSFNGQWSYGDAELLNGWLGVRESTDSRLAAATGADFSGEWETNFGRMSLALQSGNRLSGTFAGKVNRGTVEGSVDVNAGELQLNWSDEKAAGRATFHLLDGKSGIRGEWWYASGKYGGAWYGVRPVDVTGCISGDCENGEGIYIWADGKRFDGAWQNGAPHGPGRDYAAGGKLLRSGIWLEGIYRGSVISGDVQNGTGELKTPEGHVYSGQFSGYLPEGDGKMTFANGDTYEGQFTGGQAHGRGIYRFAEDKAEYEGFFRKGTPQGRGVYRFAGGHQYEGYFRNGIRHTNGTLTLASGARYDGQWRNDLPDGYGKWYFANGDVYEGEFREGKRHGDGQYRFVGGETIAGNWKRDIPENSDAPQPAPLQPTETIPQLTDALTRPDQLFLVYRSTAGNKPKTGGTVLIDPPTRAEANFFYHLVTAPALTDESAIRSFLSEQQVPVEQFQVMPVSDFADGIKQALQRFRWKMDADRIYIRQGEHWQVSAENFASNE